MFKMGNERNVVTKFVSRERVPGNNVVAFCRIINLVTIEKFSIKIVCLHLKCTQSYIHIVDCRSVSGETVNVFVTRHKGTKCA